MKNRFSLFILYVSLSSPFALAQAPDSLNWFPSKTSDLWEYLVVGGGVVDTFRISNIRDSLGADGKIHLRQYQRYINPIREESYKDYVIDAGITEVLEKFTEPTDPPEFVNVPRYRFNVKQGDKWVVYAYPIGGYEMARVRRIYVGTLFNRNTSLMEMQYYMTRDSADTVGLTRSTPTLARGFGLVVDGGGDVFNTYYLRGAVIDGALYGDTTRIVTSVGDYPSCGFPKSFELHQNYPNPFNPSTTISYGLPMASRVTVRVFNALGQEVAVLVDEEKQAGAYQVRWTANVPSGVYFYRIQAAQYSECQKMVVLR